MRLIVQRPTAEARARADQLLDEAGMACVAAIKGELPEMEPATALAVIKSLSSDVKVIEATEAALLGAEWPANSPGADQRARNVIAGAGLDSNAVALLHALPMPH